MKMKTKIKYQEVFSKEDKDTLEKNNERVTRKQSTLYSNSTHKESREVVLKRALSEYRANAF